MGDPAYRFEQQITDLVPFLSQNWKAGVSPKTGNPVYERPVVLVLYRDDHKFLLDPIIPRPGGTMAKYDLVIASQPYRARLARIQGQARDRAARQGAGTGGCHRHPFPRQRSRPGDHPEDGPGDNPFIHDCHQIMKAVKHELGPAGRDLNFNAYADNRSLFRYDMHTLPSEISDQSIGTSTLSAAWNAAIYVAQVEDHRLADVVADGRYLEATREALHSGGRRGRGPGGRETIPGGGTHMWTAPSLQEVVRSGSDRLRSYVRPVDGGRTDRLPRWVPRREFQTGRRCRNAATGSHGVSRV